MDIKWRMKDSERIGLTYLTKLKFRLIGISYDSAETVLFFQKGLNHSKILGHSIEQATLFSATLFNA